MAKQLENSPHFFRIILNFILQNGTLELSRNFVKNYGKHLSKYARLKVPTGAESKIGLKRCNGRAWLCQGWREFVEKYSIKCGYFLVFRYEGGSLFSVLIFDLSTCEIDYARTSQKEVEKYKLIQVKEEDSDADKCPHRVQKGRGMKIANKSRKLRTGQPLSCIENKSLGKVPQVTTTKRKQLGTTSARQRVLERAKAFQSPNLHFVVMMQPSHKQYLNIPVGPARSWLLKKGNNRISLSGADGRTWSIKYTIGTPPLHRVRFFSGWTKFWEDNHLQEGDVCAFDLVKSTPMTFKVTMFQITDDEEEIDKNETLMLTDIASCQGKKRSTTSWKECGNKGVTSDAKDRVRKRVGSFKTKSPHFIICMTAFYISPRAKVHIPSAHARRYLKEDGENVIILHGSNGRTWPVQYQQWIKNSDSMRKSHSLANGWKDFVSDNRLRVGDFCIFEKMIGKAMAYKVTTFHIADHA